MVFAVDVIVALVTKCVASFQRRLKYALLAVNISNKRHFACCILLAKWNILVLKEGISYGWQRRLVHSVAVIKNCSFIKLLNCLVANVKP